ncbi:MAG: glycosyltransferase family 87 protein [Vicinamibacterales bacterium]
MTTTAPPSASRSRWLAHPLLQVGLGALLGVLAGYYSLVFRIALGQHGNDFGKFYFATKAWAAGGSLYAPNIATRMLVGGEWREFLNMNPPHFHLLVLPLTRLDLLPAFVVWTLVNAAAGVVAVMLALRELRWPLRAAAVLPTLVLSLTGGALNAIAATGQVTGLLLVALTLAWRDARHERWVACGLWLGVLIGVKPFLALFIPGLALTGRWRALVSAAAGGAGTFAVGVLTFGWPSHLEWLDSLESVSWAWSSMNASILGLAARCFSASPVFTPPVLAPSLTSVLWFVAALPTAWLSIVIARRSVDHLFAGATLGALLLSPLGWIYYLPLALPSCLALWQHRRPHAALVGLAATSVPLFVPLLWGSRGLAVAAVGSVYFWGTFALWVGVVLSRDRSRPPHGTASGSAHSTVTSDVSAGWNSRS